MSCWACWFAFLVSAFTSRIRAERMDCLPEARGLRAGASRTRRRSTRHRCADARRAPARRRRCRAVELHRTALLPRSELRARDRHLSPGHS
jgi:hypothetical protein